MNRNKEGKVKKKIESRASNWRHGLLLNQHFREHFIGFSLIAYDDSIARNRNFQVERWKSKANNTNQKKKKNKRILNVIENTFEIHWRIFIILHIFDRSISIYIHFRNVKWKEKKKIQIPYANDIKLGTRNFQKMMPWTTTFAIYFNWTKYFQLNWNCCLLLSFSYRLDGHFQFAAKISDQRRYCPNSKWAQWLYVMIICTNEFNVWKRNWAPKKVKRIKKKRWLKCLIGRQNDDSCIFLGTKMLCC